MNELNKINFNGREILVVEEDGIKYVAMKPIVEAMGLNWTRQFRRITSDPVLNSVVAEMAITAQDGKNYQSVCLPIDFLNGWLFKIDSNRYKNDLDRFNAIVTYQKECYRVLSDYFHKGVAVNPNADLLETVERLQKSVKELAEYGIPDSRFGEISNRTGLPRDIIVKAYHKSDRRIHSPQTKQYFQLVLNLSRDDCKKIEVKI